VARELRDAALGRGDYRGSAEELTPGLGDPLAALPVVVTALATLVRPAAWRHFAGGSVSSYALTPAAWRELATRAAARPDDGSPGAGAPGLPAGIVSRR